MNYQQSINLCVSDLMSICTADRNKEQSNCSYYEKSERESRCMYFVFDEYCDCLNAQLNAAKV